MPEINNSLAAQIKVPEINLGNTLAQVTAIQKGQQEIQHNQFLYDQGGGYTPSELQTKAVTQQQHLENAGRIGSAYIANPDDKTWSWAVDQADKAGLIKGGSLEKAQYLSLPPQQRANVAKALQQAGQPSQAAIEQTGIPAGNRTAEEGKNIPYAVAPNEPVISRTEAATGGRKSGPSQAQVDNAIKTRRNFDGSPRVLSTADIVGSPTFNDRAGDMFTPQVVRGPDGSISSSVTPATTAMQAQAVKQYEKAGEVAQTAQGLSMRLDMMDHSADVLNKTGWSSTGSGANAKLGAAKAVNSLLQSVGLPAAIDPNKVANWEDLNKETTRAGFDLARTLGSREAATIVQSSVSAVPGAENSPMGFKLVSSGIRQAIQREKDYYNFATEYAKSHRGNTFGADVEFNKQFPPELYSKTAVANSIDPKAIERLKVVRDNSLFDQKYGTGMADFILSHDRTK